jgi:hypothetical protein
VGVGVKSESRIGKDALANAWRRHKTCSARGIEPQRLVFIISMVYCATPSTTLLLLVSHTVTCSCFTILIALPLRGDGPGYSGR